MANCLQIYFSFNQAEEGQEEKDGDGERQNESVFSPNCSDYLFLYKNWVIFKIGFSSISKLLLNCLPFFSGLPLGLKISSFLSPLATTNTAPSIITRVKLGYQRQLRWDLGWI